MDFNIRAISVAESVPFDARTPVHELLGKEIIFRSGLPITITLPDNPGAFDQLPEPERLLTALVSWARVYDYPHGEDKIRYILAPAENPDPGADILMYRLDLLQPARIKPGPRLPVQILGGAVMTYDECTRWLADLSYEQRLANGTVLQRPRLPKPKAPVLRIAWVGPEKLGGESLPARFRALGSVKGAEITHVGPQSFALVKGNLAGISGLNAVVLCIGTAVYITRDVAPKTLPPEAVHHCYGTTLAAIEEELFTIIEATRTRVEEARAKEGVNQHDELLRLMLRGMVSHSKIGQSLHCDRDEVLTAVRSRRLDVPTANAILDDNCEAHHDTKTSEKLFLYKDHNDGKQYFLNPKKMVEIKLLIADPGG
jgi:hypothetical protein